ncbi:hypothetical protein AVEN_142403-1 [Araneus ventricosus]|uniref:DNA2/NAM7 helicase helicase domain-containing protein n=1 Tax=Araneus ventricosus TaxID=182803 RepID=A0A4Y2XB42_ARAVE|nr:hypothetical protein AVEN_104431-1 [Araneus ventricosus]GBO46855.1 hypothetical protein AVEN_142403-1 [Araneus ventricosus]
MPRIKRTKKRKRSELIEISRLPQPVEMSATEGLISPVKKEEEPTFYPDTRFETSTTLFPAAKKPAISDDCVIIENVPQTEIKVEVIDLTDDSDPIAPICSPVKICSQENRLPPLCKDITKKAEMNKEVSFDESAIVPPTDNLTKIKIEQSESAENQIETNFENIHSSVNKNEASETQNIRIKSEPDKENEDGKLVDDKVPVLNTNSAGDTENVAEACDNHLFSDVPIKLEPNENRAVSENSTSVTDDGMRTGINSVDRSVKREKNETDDNCEGNDFEPCEPRIFPCKFLKYLNCYPLYDGDEIKQCLSVLTDLKRDKNEIIAIESQKIPGFADSQDKFELCLADKREELPNLQVSERKSSNLEVDRTVHKISCKELVDFKLNIANLDSNSASSQLEKSINERQVQNSLNSDGLGDETRQNVSTNMRFESPSNMSESSRLSYSDSHAIYFNSPVGTNSPIEDDCPSIISLSSIDGNKRCETSMKGKKNRNEELPSTDFLRQILDNAKCSDDIRDISSPVNPPFDPVEKPNIIIDENIFQNKSQINLYKNKLAKTVSDETEKPSNHNEIKYQNFSKRLPVPCGNDFKAQNVPFRPPSTNCESFEIPPKRIKMSEAPISKDSSDKKLSVEEYKKRVTALMARQHSQPDCNLNNHLPSDIPSNSSDCSPGSSNFDRNMFLLPGNRPNRSLPTCSDTSLGNPGYFQMFNTSYPQDPRLARNYAPAPYIDVNSQKTFGPFNINQAYPSQSLPEATKPPIHPPVKQTTSVSRTYAVLNSHSVQSATQTFNPPANEVKNQQVKQWLSQIKSFNPSDFNERSSEKNNSVLHPSPASESGTFSTTQYNPQHLVQGVGGRQPLSSLQRLASNASSTSSQSHHLVSQEIHPPMLWHSALHHDHYFPESVNREYMINPPLTINNPSPPVVEKSPSIASNRSASSLSHNHKTKLAAANTLPVPSQSSFVSLFPKRLREDIGRNVIETNDVYLIIIERNIDWIHGIDKETDVSKISKIGCKFQQVRDNYENHLTYYNTYFPLLLLECFSKISTALKAIRAKERTEKNICKVVQYEKQDSYVRFKCESFIHHSYVENIPKDGHIVLVKFATVPQGSVMMLGYVCSSTTRAYSNRHDDGNEILKYLNVNKNTDLIKIKITFHTVFVLPDINLNLPIYLSKLTSIKKALVQNEALKELPRSPLCGPVLSPRNYDIKGLVLPRRQDINPNATVVHGMVRSLNPSSPQLTVIESPPFTDSFLAIVQIVDEIKQSKIPGKVLVCVRAELLSQMAMNLIETSSDLIIINRKRESFHEKLQNRVLDVMVSNLSKAQSISDHAAKSKVLQEADVLLAVTGTCFYENVKCIARDLTFCIIHEAHSFTEPESLPPLLYGIRHLFLIGDPDDSCYLSSKCATYLGYSKSLFHRVYNVR